MSAVRRTLCAPRNALYALSEALWYLVQALGRPRTRGECAGMARPCPWVSCRHHLAGDVTPSGTYRVRNESPLVRWRSVSLPVWHRPGEARLEEAASVAVRLEDTCVLDVADRGPTTTHRIAGIMRLHEKSVRDIERAAHPKIRRGRLCDE